MAIHWGYKKRIEEEISMWNLATEILHRILFRIFEICKDFLNVLRSTADWHRWEWKWSDENEICGGFLGYYWGKSDNCQDILMTLWCIEVARRCSDVLTTMSIGHTYCMLRLHVECTQMCHKYVIPIIQCRYTQNLSQKRLKHTKGMQYNLAIP